VEHATGATQLAPPGEVLGERIPDGLEPGAHIPLNIGAV
jgi:hypothetical protein